MTNKNSSALTAARRRRHNNSRQAAGCSARLPRAPHSHDQRENGDHEASGGDFEDLAVSLVRHFHLIDHLAEQVGLQDVAPGGLALSAGTLKPDVAEDVAGVCVRRRVTDVGTTGFRLAMERLIYS